MTRAHNARSYDVDHVCMKSKPVDVNVPAAAFNRCCRHADFTNSNDSSCSLRVVLYETREAIEIGLHCVYTSLIFSEAFKKLNPVFRKPISGYAAHNDIKGRTPDPISPGRPRRKGVWLRETNAVTRHLQQKLCGYWLVVAIADLIACWLVLSCFPPSFINN